MCSASRLACKGQKAWAVRGSRWRKRVKCTFPKKRGKRFTSWWWDFPCAQASICMSTAHWAGVPIGRPRWGDARADASKGASPRQAAAENLELGWKCIHTTDFHPDCTLPASCLHSACTLQVPCKQGLLAPISLHLASQKKLRTFANRSRIYATSAIGGLNTLNSNSHLPWIFVLKWCQQRKSCHFSQNQSDSVFSSILSEWRHFLWLIDHSHLLWSCVM